MCRSVLRCGDPLAPGSSRRSAGILQDRAGEERDFKRSLFTHRLGPGEYNINVMTRGVEAAPITFRVRERSATERSEEHTSELQSQSNLVCRLLLEKKKHKAQDASATKTYRHSAGQQCLQRPSALAATIT